MSSLPPIAGSLLQSQLASQQASELRDADRNQRANTDHRRARTVSERDSMIGGAEDSAGVHADAEGSGSQGRAFSDEPEAPPPPPAEAPLDDTHLDIQA